MAALDILVEAGAQHWRAAAVADGRLRDFIVVANDGRASVGAIHLGRVVRVVPGMGGAFVEIGLDRPALLDIGKIKPREGDILAVQIVEAAAGSKAARVATRLALAGRTLVLLPDDGSVVVSKRIADAAQRRRLAKTLGDLRQMAEGIIARSAAVAADDKSLAMELNALRARGQKIVDQRVSAAPPLLLHADPPAARLMSELAALGARRIVADTAATARALRDAAPDLADCVAVNDEPGALFERHDVADALAALEGAHVALPSGGALTIETTAALTAIDVDSGTASGSKLRLATNLEAAREAARQIRLRDTAGLVLVDFIRMDAKADRARVLAELRAASADDRREVQILGFTAAGLVELIRSRRARVVE